MTATTADPAEQSQPSTSANTKRVQGGLLDPKMLWRSTPDALGKLDPRTLWRNPVMFIVEIGATWSTVLAIINPTWFAWLTVVWLWLTVFFANLAEAVAEGQRQGSGRNPAPGQDPDAGPAAQGLVGRRAGRGGRGRRAVAAAG